MLIDLILTSILKENSLLITIPCTARMTVFFVALFTAFIQTAYDDVRTVVAIHMFVLLSVSISNLNVTFKIFVTNSCIANAHKLFILI